MIDRACISRTGEPKTYTSCHWTVPTVPLNCSLEVLAAMKNQVLLRMLVTNSSTP